LLRGVLGLDDAALAGVASLSTAGGRISVLASVVPSDGVEGIETLDGSWEPRICDAWARHAIDLVGMWPATNDDIRRSGSSWARRLRSGHSGRVIQRLEFVRSAPIAKRAGSIGR
jgi:hypothetical protein